TALVGKAPFALGVDTTTKRVFVANLAGNTVSVLDDDTGALLRTVPVGTAPSDVEVDDANSHVFIANTGSDTVSVLDDQTGRVLRVIPVGKHPIVVVKDAVNPQAFVVNRIGNTLTVLGGNLGQATTTQTPQHKSTSVGAGPIVRTIAVGRDPAAVEMDKNAGHAFVLNLADNTVTMPNT